MLKIYKHQSFYYMKNILLAFLFSLYFGSANSQDILEIVAKEVCSCTSSKTEKLSSGTQKNIQMELGICIMSSVAAHENEITEKYGNVLEADGAMEKLGRDVGLKMATSCPDVLMTIANSGIGEDEVVEEKALTVEGKVVEIKSEQFLTVVIKDNSGRSHSMLILTFFEDSNLLTENKLKKNDKVSVEYWEQEFYDAKAMDFRYYKVIQGIKKI